MHFLAQMYAPVDELPRAFHRVLYVFCCRRNVCLRKENGGKGAIRVLRSQLPEKNELYAPDFKHSKKEEELELMDDDELDALEEKEWKKRVLDANEAEARARKALNLASESKKIGNVHYSQNRWKEAIESYTKGLEELRDVYVRSPYRLLQSSASIRDLICVEIESMSSFDAFGTCARSFGGCELCRIYEVRLDKGSSSTYQSVENV